MISNHPDPKSFLMYLPPDIQACFNHYSLPLLQAKKYFNSDSLYRPGKLRCEKISMKIVPDSNNLINCNCILDSQF